MILVSIIRKLSLPRQIALGVAIMMYASCVLFALFNGCAHCEFSEPRELLRSRRAMSYMARPCRPRLDHLGVVKIDITDKLSMNVLELQNRQVKLGGRWRPQSCDALETVAIVIPYRNRYEHLCLLLKRLHPMLRVQRIDYHIFVIEQSGQDKFNRGKLMNVGVKEALKIKSFDCFIFHDVDMLPVDDRNIYMCDGHARHLVSAPDSARYHVKYYNYAGGVIAINRTNLNKINGYSNFYWGWGNEDDDLSARILVAGLKLTRPPEAVGRFRTARHKPATRSSNGNSQFLGWRGRWSTDGLNATRGMNYSVMSKTSYKLYTHIITDLGPSRNYTVDTSQDTTKESLWWFVSFYYP